jgi:hypothetical protein
MLVELKPVKNKIRALMSQFSLFFRLRYHEILPKIVKLYAGHFLILLTEIPEMLPTQYDESNPHDIRNGIWKDLDL